MIKLTDVVTIQEKSNEQDDFGHLKDIWVDVLPDIRARVTYKSGSENFEAAKTMSKRVILIRTWFNTSVKSSMRVKYGEEVYDIKSVLPDNEFRKMMILEAEDYE